MPTLHLRLRRSQGGQKRALRRRADRRGPAADNKFAGVDQQVVRHDDGGGPGSPHMASRNASRTALGISQALLTSKTPLHTCCNRPTCGNSWTWKGRYCRRGPRRRRWPRWVRYPARFAETAERIGHARARHDAMTPGRPVLRATPSAMYAADISCVTNRYGRHWLFISSHSSFS